MLKDDRLETDTSGQHVQTIDQCAFYMFILLLVFVRLWQTGGPSTCLAPLVHRTNGAWCNYLSICGAPVGTRQRRASRGTMVANTWY
jgi:hypothetical protein